MKLNIFMSLSKFVALQRLFKMIASYALKHGRATRNTGIVRSQPGTHREHNSTKQRENITGAGRNNAI